MVPKAFPMAKVAFVIIVPALLAFFSVILTGCPGTTVLSFAPVTILYVPATATPLPTATPDQHAFININVCLPDIPYGGCTQPKIDMVLNGTEIFGFPVWSGAAEPEVLSGPNTMVFTLIYDPCNPAYYFTVSGTTTYTDVFTAVAGNTYNVSTGGECPLSSSGPITLTYP